MLVASTTERSQHLSKSFRIQGIIAGVANHRIIKTKTLISSMCIPTDNTNIDKSQGEEKNTGPWITPHDDHDELNGNCGRAVVTEFKRTVGTYWCEEMKNFNQKTVAVSFFIFFAAVAPAITFGAVYAKSTNNYIGPVEMLTATAWCGMFYALFGGQPMVSLWFS
jgi:hypothetical protein